MLINFQFRNFHFKICENMLLLSYAAPGLSTPSLPYNNGMTERWMDGLSATHDRLRILYAFTHNYNSFCRLHFGHLPLQ